MVPMESGAESGQTPALRVAVVMMVGGRSKLNSERIVSDCAIDRCEMKRGLGDESE